MKEQKVAGQPENQVFLEVKNGCVVVTDSAGVARKRIPACKSNSLTLKVTNKGTSGLIFGISAGTSKQAFTGNTNAAVLAGGATRTLNLNPHIGGLEHTNCGTTTGTPSGVKQWPVSFETDPRLCGNPGDPEMVIEC